MPSYMLLLYDNPANWQNISPQEMQKALEKYMTWGSRLRKEGVILASHKLADDVGKVMRGPGQTRVTDGPYSETKEVLGGYYILDCPDIDKALQAAERCPAALTGSIEVRPIIGMPINPPTMALAAE